MTGNGRVYSKYVSAYTGVFKTCIQIYSDLLCNNWRILKYMDGFNSIVKSAKIRFAYGFLLIAIYEKRIPDPRLTSLKQIMENNPMLKRTKDKISIP